MKVRNIKKSKGVVFILAVLCLAFCTITVIFAADKFTYDSLGRLKTATHGNETKVEYSYDKTGNRSTEKVNHIPNIPSSPDPYDGATGILTLPLLAWNGGDSDGEADMVTYSIFLDQNQAVDLIEHIDFNPT
jgi:YD repeat-containing protein